MGTQGNGTNYTSEFVQQNGGIFIELVVDVSNDPMTLLDNWVATYDLNCSVMHDKDGQARIALEDMGNDREWAFIVDLSNMEIVWRDFGSLGGNLQLEQYAAVQGLVEICSASYLNCPTPQ